MKTEMAHDDIMVSVYIVSDKNITVNFKTIPNY